MSHTRRKTSEALRTVKPYKRKKHAQLIRDLAVTYAV